MANECKIAKNWSIKRETFMNSMTEILYTDKIETTIFGYECYFALEQCDDNVAIYFFDNIDDDKIMPQIVIKEMKLSIPSANYIGDLLQPIDVPKKSHFDGYKYAVIIKRNDIVYHKKKFFIDDFMVLEFRGILECVKEWSIKSLGERLWDSEDQEDFTFIIGDKEIKAHQFILHNFSTVLSNMFNEDIGQLEIKDFTLPVVKAVLALCYDKESIHFYTDVLLDCLKFADTYDMPIIKEKISRQLCDKITTKNICKLANKCIECKAPALKAYCINFISKCIREGKSYDGAMDLNDDIIKELYKATILSTEIV